MFMVHVTMHVKPEFADAFREATIANGSNSVQEAGIALFDVLQHTDDPTRFLLVEVYRSPEDLARHKEPEHYRVWRDDGGRPGVCRRAMHGPLGSAPGRSPHA